MKITWLDTMHGNVKDDSGYAVALLTRRPKSYGPKHITVLEYTGDEAARPFTVIGGADSDEDAAALVVEHYAR